METECYSNWLTMLTDLLLGTKCNDQTSRIIKQEHKKEEQIELPISSLTPCPFSISPFLPPPVWTASV